jgi:hypothetical protein
MAIKKTARTAASRASRSGKPKPPARRTPAKRPNAAPPAPVAPPPAAPAAARNPWIVWILAALILLVGAEVAMMVKGKLDRQGELKLIRVIGERGGPPEATGKFWGPGNLRVDRKRDRVCMIDSSFFKVMFWNLQDATFITELDKKGVHEPVPANNAIVQGNFVPSNGAFDSQGNLYVLDKVNNEVSVISPEYKITATWKIPACIEIAADDNQDIIYLSDRSNNDLMAYSPEGKLLRRFGGDELNSPGFMAVDSQNGNIYVIDRGAKKVVAFSADGKLKRTWKLNLTTVGNPDIDVAQGKVFVCELDSQKVWVYSPQGKLLTEAAAWFPGVMAEDSAGLVYLSGDSGVSQYRLVKKKSE